MMNKEKLFVTNNTFNLKKADRLFKILSDTIVEETVFEFKIEGPDSLGWMHIIIVTNDNHRFMIEANERCIPFQNIILWLEEMLDYSIRPSGVFMMECDTHNIILSYDYLGYVREGNIDDQYALLQLGNDDSYSFDYSHEEYDDIIQLIVPIRPFVKKTYLTIKEYINKNRVIFKDNWKLPNGSKYDIRTIMKSFYSSKIEQEIF